MLQLRKLTASSPIQTVLHVGYVEVLSYYILADYLKPIEAIDREHHHGYSNSCPIVQRGSFLKLMFWEIYLYIMGWKF